MSLITQLKTKASKFRLLLKRKCQKQGMENILMSMQTLLRIDKNRTLNFVEYNELTKTTYELVNKFGD